MVSERSVQSSSVTERVRLRIGLFHLHSLALVRRGASPVSLQEPDGREPTIARRLLVPDDEGMS